MGEKVVKMTQPSSAPAVPENDPPQPAITQSEPAAPASQPAQPAEKTYDISTWAGLGEALRDKIGDDKLRGLVYDRVENILAGHGLQEYLTIFLFDDDPISDFHGNRLYGAASAGERQKDILLITESNGGSIEPAYLASKALKRFAATKFVVAVPRRAKSAATLLALGADEIHMGLMSQLGPIDPQINEYPALALGNALEVLAKLASTPTAAMMIANYLKAKLNISDLGLFERVSESAAQYAERLLSNKLLPTGTTAEQIAKLFVYHYKDHGFAIDVDEAKRHLGQGVVKDGTPEYLAARDISAFFEELALQLRMWSSKAFWWVGGSRDGLVFFDRKRS